MQRIGCSLIAKATKTQVLALGMGPLDFDVPDEKLEVRGGADVGWEDATYKLVERWQDGAAPDQWHSQIGSSVAFDGEKVIETLKFSAVRDIVPASVSMRQARLALNAAGKLDDVNSAILAADKATQISWEYSGVLERNNPILETMAGQIGMTNAEVDDLFRAASAI